MQKTQAKNPRISITLKPTLYSALVRYSNISGTSISGVVSELLNDAEPLLERLSVVMETAKNAEGELKMALREGLETSEENLRNQLSVLMTDLSDAGDLFSQIEQAAVKHRKVKKVRGVKVSSEKGKGNA